MTEAIFLLSLPRSGSTLLQRILSSSRYVETAPEPWILLPLLTADTDEYSFSIYGETIKKNAINDVKERIGSDTYRESISLSAHKIYSALANGNRYFLDKTPRYHFLAKKLYRYFPDAKYIVLWRNPLAIASSIVNTWGKGKWKLHGREVDLYLGLESLIEFSEEYGDRENVHTIRYEDLVTNPRSCAQELTRFLGIEDEDVDEMLKMEDTGYAGGMGDKEGVKKFGDRIARNTDAWKECFNNPVRRMWARRYLRYLGAHRLELMGYDMDELLSELRTGPHRWLNILPDLFRIGRGLIWRLTEPAIRKDKIRKLMGHGKGPYIHR